MTVAIVLAAGQGTRLRPLTDDSPKCLVPLAGQALLERQARVLRAAGIDDINVAGGFCISRIEDRGFRTAFNERFATTNMVTTLFCAQQFFDPEQDLIISYGDIVYQPENLAALLACDAPVAVMVDRDWRKVWDIRFEDPLSDAESLLFDENDYLTEIGKTPSSFNQIHGQYTGLIKIDRTHVTKLAEFYCELDREATYDGKNFDNMYMTSFLQELIDSGWLVKAAFVRNGWLEVDAVSDLELYESMERAGTLSKLCRLD